MPEYFGDKRRKGFGDELWLIVFALLFVICVFLVIWFDVKLPQMPLKAFMVAVESVVLGIVVVLAYRSFWKRIGFWLAFVSFLLLHTLCWRAILDASTLPLLVIAGLNVLEFIGFAYLFSRFLSGSWASGPR